jgi:hypothetical protein
MNPLAHLLGTPINDQLFRDRARIHGAEMEDNVQVPISAIEPEYWTINRFAEFLAQLPDIREHHKMALSLLGQKRFVERYCGILEAYYNSLHNETETQIERTALHVLQRRTNTIRVAYGIIDSLAEAERLGNGRKEAHEQPITRSLEQENEEDIERDVAGLGGREYLNNTVHARQSFFLRGPSFREFSLSIRLLTLKSSLREVVETVPTSLIRICTENNSTVANSIKLSLEKYTEMQWDWWPLTSPVPHVPTGMRRLEWKVTPTHRMSKAR